MSYSHFGAPTVYNGTGEEGGDPTVVNLNQWYAAGDVAMIIICSALVYLMVPGIGLLYAGLARRKSALQQLFVAMMSYSVICLQWWFWGYSLCYSTTSSNSFIGNLHHIGLRHVMSGPSQGSPLVSTLGYCFFQLQFAAVTAALVCGAVAERGRSAPVLLFAFCWATIVYCPLAYWVWNANGWAFKWGILDFAGGGPVEIASGMSALAFSQVLGKRNGSSMSWYRPHNLSMVMMGTFLLMFGWIGFNAGSAFGANQRALYAAFNTFLTAATASVSWVALDYRLTHKLSLIGWCSGTISGLVAATPASGFIPLWASVILGLSTGVICNFATKFKFLIGIDDALDVFAEHTVGGILGLLANAFFAKSHIIALDGVNNEMTGGFIDGTYSIMYKQVAYIFATAAYAYGVSYVIAFSIDRLPGMQLRASEAAEWLGMDEDQHQEFAYDFVEVRRDYMAWGSTSAAENSVRPQLGVPQHQQILDSIHVPEETLDQYRSSPPNIRERVVGPVDPSRLAISRYNRHLREAAEAADKVRREEEERAKKAAKANGTYPHESLGQRIVNTLRGNSEKREGWSVSSAAGEGDSIPETQRMEEKTADETAGEEQEEALRQNAVDPTTISAATHEMPPPASQ